MSKYAFGIDLGTTNSAIAVVSGGKPAEVIRLSNGEATLPSCVMYRDGRVIVGRYAYEHRHDIKHVVYSSKRHIGTPHTYAVYANGDDMPPVKVTPTDVAYEILRTLKEEAEKKYGKDEVDEVVITVPAYFTYQKRAETKKAAERAGMKVLALINEPTAAALAYACNTETSDKFLVYDLGGGTFDVTLLSMINDVKMPSIFADMDLSDKTAKVISSAGNDHLGGDDLDELVYRIACKSASEQYKQKSNDPTFDLARAISPEMKEKILLLIESIKKSGDTSTVMKTIKGEQIGKETDIDLFITHDMFVEATRKIYQNTLVKLTECVGRQASSYNRLILIGGSTKSAILREMIANDFTCPIYTNLNPDEAVALGAAVQSSIIKGETNISVTDVLPQSIGVDCVNVMDDVEIPGRFNKILLKDTPLPAAVSIPVTTYEDDQRQARISVYQGESTLSANNTYLGDLVIDLPKKYKKGEAPITITASVDASGLLSVTASIGNKKESITLQNVLNPEENQAVTAKDKLLSRYMNTIKTLPEDKQGALLEIYNDVKEGKSSLTELRVAINNASESYSKMASSLTDYFAADLGAAGSRRDMVKGEEEEEED